MLSSQQELFTSFGGVGGSFSGTSTFVTFLCSSFCSSPSSSVALRFKCRTFIGSDHTGPSHGIIICSISESFSDHAHVRIRLNFWMGPDSLLIRLRSFLSGQEYPGNSLVCDLVPCTPSLCWFEHRRHWEDGKVTREQSSAWYLALL